MIVLMELVRIAASAEDNYTYALPLLKKYNLVGDFAIVTSTVGKPEYMNWQQLNDLKNIGMGISSHTFNHCYLAVNVDPKTATKGPFAKSPVNDSPNQICPNFTSGNQLNTGQIRGELLKSKQDLENKLSIKIKSLVYPFGKYNEQVISIAKELGYEIGFTVEPQDKKMLDLNKLFELPRIRINGQQTGEIVKFLE